MCAAGSARASTIANSAARGRCRPRPPPRPPARVRPLSRAIACGPMLARANAWVATARRRRSPRHDRADGRLMRLDADAQLRRLGIEGDDRASRRRAQAAWRHHHEEREPTRTGCVRRDPRRRARRRGRPGRRALFAADPDLPMPSRTKYSLSPTAWRWPPAPGPARSSRRREEARRVDEPDLLHLLGKATRPGT